MTTITTQAIPHSTNNAWRFVATFVAGVAAAGAAAVGLSALTADATIDAPPRIVTVQASADADCRLGSTGPC
ncbi:MAG TPA: hypothetical protein VM345_07990 [Acidimicrobiales bacterium]|nr:hypothetical protein [Acidimicrobiales bacterium]